MRIDFENFKWLEMVGHSQNWKSSQKPSFVRMTIAPFLLLGVGEGFTHLRSRCTRSSSADLRANISLSALFFHYITLQIR